MDSGLENMQLPLSEDVDFGQEGAVRVLEGVGQTETKHETTEHCEGTHENEQPEPTSLVADAAHVKNTIGQQLGGGLAELVSKVEEHDTLRRLAACVPGRQRPETTGDEARLGHAEEETGGDEGAVVVLEGLEGGNGAEEEELQSEPLSGADAVQDHVGGNLEEDDAEGEHLLADVELVLGDANFLHEVVGQGIGNVTAIELCELLNPRSASRIGRIIRVSWGYGLAW